MKKKISLGFLLCYMITAYGVMSDKEAAEYAAKAFEPCKKIKINIPKPPPNPVLEMAEWMKNFNIRIDHAIFVQTPTTNNLEVRQNQTSQQDQAADQQTTIESDQDDIRHLHTISSTPYIKTFYTAATILTAIYVVHCFFAYRTHRLLNNLEAWCNWNYTSTLGKSNIPLINEMVRKIQTTYSDVNNPADHTMPINVFLKTLEYEQNVLKQYLACMKFGSLLRLHKILPGGDMRAIAHEKLKTLSFLKSLFLEWAHKDQEKFLKQHGI